MIISDYSLLVSKSFHLELKRHESFHYMNVSLLVLCSLIPTSATLASSGHVHRLLPLSDVLPLDSPFLGSALRCPGAPNPVHRGSEGYFKKSREQTDGCKRKGKWEDG